MEIRDLIGESDWPRISELFEAVGWGTRPPAEVALAFGQSSFVRAAFENGKLIGFGRTVDDGRYYALIVDLVVDPDHQGKGIGAALLKELRECVKSYEFCTLTAAPGKAGFYERQGWVRQSSSFIWPTDDKQAQRHAGQRL